MTCPVCFFREDYQKQLKKRTFGIDRFESKLTKYKKIFIEDMHQMGSISSCSCQKTYSQDGMILWTDSFLHSLKDAESEVSSAFDTMISIYEDYISKNQKLATDSLWSHLTRQDLLTQIESPIKYERLLFRARPKGGFDEEEIEQYFHIPFSKRHLVGNQRFSVSGQPMVYFGNSVLVLTKELERNVPDLAVAAFLPNYSEYYSSKIFSLTNHIGNCIENSLPGIFSAGSGVSYDETTLTPNRHTITGDIHKAILMHLCTFPTEFKGAFVAEYVIPQLLTTALLEHGYSGIVFPSTKDYTDLYGQHRFSSHHLNLGLFVPYDKSNSINENLLNTFTTFTPNGLEKYNLTTNDILNKIADITEVTKQSSHNNIDCLLPISQLETHIDYMKESEICRTKYFETDIGKLELDLYMKMLCHLEKLVE